MESESVGRILGAQRMGSCLGCVEGAALRLSLAVFLLLPPGYDKSLCSTMTDLAVTQY